MSLRQGLRQGEPMSGSSERSASLRASSSDGVFRIGAYQAPDKGSFCGPDISQTASYTWKRSGNELTLNAEQDACADRDAVLSGRWRPR